MARSGGLLGGLLGLLLAGGLAVMSVSGPPDHGPVYSVAQVQALLARRPQAWTGRPLLLRGVAEVAGMCGEAAGAPLLCAPPRAVLGDAGPPAVAGSLPLAWASPDPLLTAMRRVPLLGGLLPAAQEVDWGEVATYRVALRAIADEPCAAATCYAAVVLDAAP